MSKWVYFLVPLILLVSLVHLVCLVYLVGLVPLVLLVGSRVILPGGGLRILLFCPIRLAQLRPPGFWLILYLRECISFVYSQKQGSRKDNPGALLPLTSPVVPLKSLRKQPKVQKMRLGGCLATASQSHLLNLTDARRTTRRRIDTPNSIHLDFY